MEDQLDNKKLWVALSYLFVDTETDYNAIAEVAKKYPVSVVEFALFERVAPVCIDNMLTPAPSVWWFFDEEQLLFDIESLIEKRAKQGVFGRCGSFLVGCFIRLYCSGTWAELKRAIERAKSKGAL